MTAEQHITQPRAGAVVVNVDALWGGEVRWYRLGDVSLGQRGVPQIVVFYAIAGVLACWAAASLPLVGVSPWPWGLVLAAAVAAAGLVKPNGLALHTFAPLLLGYLLGARHLLGWQPCPDPCGVWRPGRLALESDIPRPGGGELVYTGPGRITRYQQADRRPGRRTLADRLRRRPAAQLLITRPDLAALTVARELEVPAGGRLIITTDTGHRRGWGWGR